MVKQKALNDPACGNFSNIKALVAKTIIVLTGKVLMRGSRLPGRDNFGNLSTR